MSFSSRLALSVAFTIALATIPLGILIAYIEADEQPVTAGTTMLNAAAGDETLGTVVGPKILTRCRESAIYVEWSTGVSAGVVQIETAYGDDYGGTWAPLATIAFSASAPKVDIAQITGVHRHLRTRISTAVADGTVTTRLVCN